MKLPFVAPNSAGPKSGLGARVAFGLALVILFFLVSGWIAYSNVNVLREAMAVDSLDKCGIYFGTTGGQVYASADSGDNWTAIVRDLPSVVSVEVQTLK